MTPAYRFRAKCIRVIDGDTMVLDIDLGFGIHANQTIRLRNVNCPELNTEAGKAARQYVSILLAGDAAAIVVETYKDRQTFARWVADVYVDGEPLAYLIVGAGHGVVA